MRRTFLLALLIWAIVLPTEARFPRGSVNTPPITYNIVTDGSAVCDGVTDTAPAFKTFNTWARANQGAGGVVLTIPNGANCFFNTAQSIPGSVIQNAWAAGINSLVTEGTGATINSVGGQGFWLGGDGICHAGLADAAGCSARIQSVSVGASQVVLTSASLSAGYISRFSIGKWIMLSGMDIQGQWNFPFGYPPNAQVFEWRQITGVNASTGVITLDRVLTNSYLSTWPNYNSGNSGEADSGGPATIYALNDNWNQTAEYRGLTISQTGPTYGNSRYLTFRNVTASDGIIPSQNETWTAINPNMTGVNMEVDKLVGTMTMDGATIDSMTFQSASISRFVMRNSTVTGFINGSATRNEITDSTIVAFTPGATANGTSGATICTRCAIATFNPNGGIFQNTPTEYSMSSGVISFLNTNASGSDTDQRWAAPVGANIFYGAAGFNTIGLFQVLGVTQDATHTFIQTNEAGGFPAVADCCQFYAHSAPQFTCDTCTGDPALVAMSVQAGATPLAPLASYSSRTFSPTSAQGNLGTLYSKGRIVSLTVDVTQAYTGSGAATLQPTGQFHNFTIKQSDWSTFDWIPAINIKTAGSRVITPAGVTCNGVAAPTGCSGDSLGTALPEAVWVQNSLAPFMGSTFSGGTAPIFTITIQTDQGVVP